MTHAHQLIAARIAQLPELSMDSLWALWDEYFDERPNHHHRTWIESRLAYKIQEEAFGGVKRTTRKKLEQIGETGLLPKSLQSEGSRMLPGTVLTRDFDDVEHKVIVLGPKDFEYRGQRFKSLSAVAKRITGCQWSGPAFFGLKSNAKEAA
jgi:hypothetical protein